MKILLLTPPLVQLNTPYPGSMVLKGFLDQHAARLGLEVRQTDPSIEWILRIFQGPGWQRIWEQMRSDVQVAQDPLASYLRRHGSEVDSVGAAVLRFLQGRDPGLALRIVQGTLFPPPPRWERVLAAFPDPAEYMDWAFGTL